MSARQSGSVAKWSTSYTWTDRAPSVLTYKERALMRIRTIVLAGGLAICIGSGFAVTSRAAVIFDNGAPNQSGGDEMTAYVQAEDFALSSAALLTDLHFSTFEGNEGNSWDGTLQYYFFSDNSGQPASTPFATGSAINVMRAATGFVDADLHEFQYSIDTASPILLAAGTPYWIGLHANQTFDRQNIYWERSATGYGAAGLFSLGGPFGRWSTTFNHHAFQLTGATVPEPAAALLACFAVIALSARAPRVR